LNGEEKLYLDNKEAIENLEQLVAQRKTLEGTLKSVKRSLAKCEKERLQFYKQVGSLEEKTKTVETEKENYANLQEEYSAYDLYMACMHPNGIAFDIIKKKLPIINDEIAKTIANIVDFEIFFEVDGSKFDIFIKHPSYT
jgi:DNA repair exonuclease SbcCD ATPase subunit